VETNRADAVPAALDQWALSLPVALGPLRFRNTCLYRIYFVDIHLYVAVTSRKFPVWLQDGKWPPEGKLSSSSISPRGFLFFAAGRSRRICCAQGDKRPCVARGSCLRSKRCGFLPRRSWRRSCAMIVAQNRSGHFRRRAAHKPKITCLQRFETRICGRPRRFSAGLIFPRTYREIAPQRLLHRSKSA
jgi:hypothetical protein